MKKVIFALAMFASVLTYGAGSSKVKVVSDSTAVFKVYYTNAASSKVRVNIYSENGKKVFSEVIKNENGFVRPYNMSNLPAGNYKFEIVDNDEVSTYEFAYATPATKSNDLTVFVNKFSNNRFFLGLGNAANDEVTIKIVDAEGNEIYTAKELVKSQFSQLFNLEAVTSEVTFQVMKGGKVIKNIAF